MESNQTVYVAGGAVVHGSIHANRATNLRILGRGIVDVSESERETAGGGRSPEGLRRRSHRWPGAARSQRLVLQPFRLPECGDPQSQIQSALWQYNADGINICNSQDVQIRDSFVRAFDDCIVLKGLKWGNEDKANPPYHERPVRGIIVERCVIWNDWGRALEIGAETSAPEIADVVFRDCDIIRTVRIAMDIQHGDRAVVRDIRFENIRVESDDFNLRPVFQRTREEKYAVDPKDDYRPHLMFIIVRANCYSCDGQLGVVPERRLQRHRCNQQVTPPILLPGSGCRARCGRCHD